LVIETLDSCLQQLNLFHQCSFLFDLFTNHLQISRIRWQMVQKHISKNIWCYNSPIHRQYKVIHTKISY
jgi:hypothetical protein